MTCFHPLKAYRAHGGGIVFNSKEGFADRPLELACGQCKGCRIDRSVEWSIRCSHEASLHERNAFITLTYDNENLPNDLSVNVEHYQKFMKRLRKAFAGRLLAWKESNIKYYHCGEYGEENLRPHYHALLFGIDFPDKRPFKKVRGNVYYRSEELEKIWGKGHCMTGAVTRQSSAYVARYVMKKANGDVAKERYRRLDLTTGEEWYVRSEYATMSRRPAVGAAWFRRFNSDVFPDDHVVLDGKKYKVPKYYSRKLEEHDYEMHEEIKRERRKKANANKEEKTPERLAVREEVFEARMRQLKRNL